MRMMKNSKERRTALEQKLGVELPHIGNFSLDEAVAGSRNCENMIGAIQIPVGIAGPLRLHHLRGSNPSAYMIPLATTEGALVASVNRGIKAITESGGATVHSHKLGASRGPVFKVQSMADRTNLFDFLNAHFQDLKTVTEQTSHHLTLKKVHSRGVGLYQFVRFVYDTEDAMGLNMVTIATEAAVRYIEEQTGATCVALSGNYCVDKKASWQNVVTGRGTEVWAEVVLPEDVINRVLKTTAKEVYETWLAKCMLGSAVSGSIGFNAQYANIVAALFLATGQDPAHVVEGSIGITTAEVRGVDLYVSVFLPDLMVGTVGGGTGLATQKESLEILGVFGGASGGHARTLAEITAGVVLAGEVSLLSSLAEGSLARAHKTLGRGKLS